MDVRESGGRRTRAPVVEIRGEGGGAAHQSKTPGGVGPRTEERSRGKGRRDRTLKKEDEGKGGRSCAGGKKGYFTAIAIPVSDGGEIATGVKRSKL